MLNIIHSPTFALDSERNTQLRLNRLNALRFNPTLPLVHWEDQVAEVAELTLIEGRFLEANRKEVAARAAYAPSKPREFIEWFDELRENGPGQKDPLFAWLAERCSMEEMKWFLTQEVAGEAGFEDLTALTQLKLPTRPNSSLLEITGMRWVEETLKPCMAHCWQRWRNILNLPPWLRQQLPRRSVWPI
jgi:hypothetical protein